MAAATPSPPSESTKDHKHVTADSKPAKKKVNKYCYICETTKDNPYAKHLEEIYKDPTRNELNRARTFAAYYDCNIQPFVGHVMTYATLREHFQSHIPPTAESMKAHTIQTLISIKQKADARLKQLGVDPSSL